MTKSQRMFHDGIEIESQLAVIVNRLRNQNPSPDLLAAFDVVKKQMESHIWGLKDVMDEEARLLEVQP